MTKTFALVAILGVAQWPSVADACQRMTPDTAPMDQYSSVFVGRVTGLHLLGYENRLLNKPDAVDDELGALTITNGASPVSVRVAVTHSLSGIASGSVELRLAGCTLDLPELRDRGIFFVQPDAESTIVVWERDEAAFGNWHTRLGVAQHGP